MIVQNKNTNTVPASLSSGGTQREAVTVFGGIEDAEIRSSLLRIHSYQRAFTSSLKVCTVQFEEDKLTDWFWSHCSGVSSILTERQKLKCIQMPSAAGRIGVHCKSVLLFTVPASLSLAVVLSCCIDTMIA